jgi:thiol-disulfide isomerase/thioredoxin
VAQFGCAARFKLSLLKAKPIGFEIGLLFVAVAGPKISLSVTAAIIPKQKLWKGCIMSKIDVEYDFDKVLKTEGKKFVLFYAP